MQYSEFYIVTAYIVHNEKQVIDSTYLCRHSHDVDRVIESLHGIVRYCVHHTKPDQLEELKN